MGGDFGGGQGARDESRDHAGLDLGCWLGLFLILGFRWRGLLLSGCWGMRVTGGGEFEVLNLGRVGLVGALRCLCLTQSKIHYRLDRTDAEQLHATPRMIREVDWNI